MAESQLYIGAPNGVILCIDDHTGGEFKGRLYHSYSLEPRHFVSMGYMVHMMEELYDMLDYPRAATNRRSFTDQGTGSPGKKGRARKEHKKVMSDSELLNQHGYQETFIVRVQHRQNSTWQGRITWADQNKTLTFRSVWEMIHLMESAMSTDMAPEEIPDPEPWEDKEKKES